MPAQLYVDDRMNRAMVSSHVNIFATRQKRILGRIFHVEGDHVLLDDLRGRVAGWHLAATLGGGVIARELVL